MFEVRPIERPVEKTVPPITKGNDMLEGKKEEIRPGEQGEAAK